MKSAVLERPAPKSSALQSLTIYRGVWKLTELIHVVLGLSQIVQNRVRMELLLAAAAPRLGHENQLVAGDVIFLDCLRDDSLRVSVRVDVGGVPLAAVSAECD